MRFRFLRSVLFHRWAIAAGLLAGGIFPIGAQPESPAFPLWGLGGQDIHLWAEPVRDALARELRPAGISALRTRLSGSLEAQNQYLASPWNGTLVLVNLLHLPDASGRALDLRDPSPSVRNPLQYFRASAALSRRLPLPLEIHNEPDIGFCTLPPDQAMALLRPLFLGVQASSPGRPALLPSLALPPGPWAWRAAANGLFFHGHAWNFHFYGKPELFPGVIAAHRTFQQDIFAAGLSLQPSWPLWCTEANYDCVPHGPSASPSDRIRQAEALVRMASSARDHRLAAFFPFVLHDPAFPWFNLVEFSDAAGNLIPGRDIPAGAVLLPNPAFPAYLAFSRRHPSNASATRFLPDPNLAHFFHGGGGILLQWQPDLTTADPHKTSGGYAFRHTRDFAPASRNRQVASFPTPVPAPARGRVILLNLTDRVRQGRLDVDISGPMQAGGLPAAQNSLRLVPGIPLALPLVFQPLAEAGIDQVHGFLPSTVPHPSLAAKSLPNGYGRSWFQAVWKPAFPHDSAPANPARLSFSLETPPRWFSWEPVTGWNSAPVDPSGQPDFWFMDAPYTAFSITSSLPDWIGINGALLETPPPASLAAGLGSRHTFQVSQTYQDPHPMHPPQAITRTPHGLPPDAVLRLSTHRPWGERLTVRVDLMDHHGQRWSWFENQGRNYYESSQEVYLHFEDIVPFFHGHAVTGDPFHPRDVREVQLRFYCRNLHDPQPVTLEVLRAANPEKN